MKKTFVIVSVSSRVRELNILIASIKRFNKFEDYSINLLMQDNTGKAMDKIRHKERYDNIFVESKMLGCHTARIKLLKKINYDLYINLDDDMELIESTSYQESIDKAFEKSTGFVMTNWGRSESEILKKLPVQHKFIKQILMYQGGGMIYRDEIANLMRELPEAEAVFDSAWSLTAYLKGYVNYRYLGSLSIHRVCRSGGMQEFMKRTNLELTLTEFIDYKQSKRIVGNGYDWLIPLDKDLKPSAKEEHIKNIK